MSGRDLSGEHISAQRGNDTGVKERAELGGHTNMWGVGKEISSRWDIRTEAICMNVTEPTCRYTGRNELELGQYNERGSCQAKKTCMHSEAIGAPRALQ